MRLSVNIPKLREYMKFKGWDDRQLAKEMEVDYSTVFRIFKGQREPGNEFIAKLLNACKGADFEQLFILEKPLPNGDEESRLENVK